MLLTAGKKHTHDTFIQSLKKKSRFEIVVAVRLFSNQILLPIECGGALVFDNLNSQTQTALSVVVGVANWTQVLDKVKCEHININADINCNSRKRRKLSDFELLWTGQFLVNVKCFINSFLYTIFLLFFLCNFSSNARRNCSFYSLFFSLNFVLVFNQQKNWRRLDVIDSRPIGEPFARMMAPKQSVCQTNGISIMHLKWTLATLVLCAAVHLASAEYENTWNFYYEQPCCGNTNGHHIRHHRGNLNVFFVMNIEICLGKPRPIFTGINTAWIIASHQTEQTYLLLITLFSRTRCINIVHMLVDLWCHDLIKLAE